ncbi:MAG: hypothetical protein Q4E83_08460 [bacterium]|nr:hypothetical protein [bacterium]
MVAQKIGNIMILNLFFIIVFISEIIITVTIFNHILKLDKKIVALNDAIIAVNPLVKDVVLLISKISEQMVIISCDFKKNLAINLENYLLKNVSKFLNMVLLFYFNKKVYKKLRKFKFSKLFLKGFANI